MVPRSLIDEDLPAVLRGCPEALALAAEARQLVEEITAVRRSLRGAAKCDPAMVSRLTHCYDRLDDIAAAIGNSTVQQIYAAAASAAE